MPEEVVVRAEVVAGAELGVEPEVEAAYAVEVGTVVVAVQTPEVDPAMAAADIVELLVVDTGSTVDNAADISCNQNTAGSIVDIVVAVDTIVLQKEPQPEQQLGPENLSLLVGQDLFQLEGWQLFGSGPEKWSPPPEGQPGPVQLYLMYLLPEHPEHHLLVVCEAAHPVIIQQQ